MTRLSIIAILAVTSFVFSTVGCDHPQTTSVSATTDDEHGHSHDGESHQGHDADEHHGHDHSSAAAPHGGHIIDLGREGKYHAEMTDNHDDESITIYMLDANLESLQIDADSISLTLMSADDAQNFELMPTQTGEGASSFTLTDETAFNMLEAEGTQGKLRVEIEGKPFSGSFDHHGHDH